jgi:putative ABC transport system ATP-binding protein
MELQPPAPPAKPPQDLSEPAVRVSNLTKTFGEGETRIHALRDAHFEAAYGEILMIVGPSGCGKTTLLSSIAGTLSIESGEVHVFGNPLHNMKDDDITSFRAKNVGFIFQQFNLIPTLTIQENVAIPLLIQKRPRRETYFRSSEMLRKVGLGTRLKAHPAELSGGQQQRVAIARALVHEPNLIICDEPTANLDGDTGHSIMEMLSEMARQPGRCTIVVTHDTRIFPFADRMARMEDGRVADVKRKLRA